MIPSDKVIKNHLWYNNKTIGQYTNNIDVVKAELCQYVSMGEEELYQLFIYLYDADHAGR
jgi:hypothetical protein